MINKKITWTTRDDGPTQTNEGTLIQFINSETPFSKNYVCGVVMDEYGYFSVVPYPDIKAVLKRQVISK